MLEHVIPTGRLAPSPTGPLHLGHAFAFLHAWWYTRSRGGRMVLRMEDLDPTRCTAAFDAGVLRDLEWLGLDWDGSILRQSEQFPRYQEVLDTLRMKGLTYNCKCTRREIQQISAPHPGEDLRYPGTCREQGLTATDPTELLGQRLRVEPVPSTVDDQLQGLREFHVAQECGDFLLWTRGGLPSYQFAVTLDDHHQGVTEVIRGRDLLASTARQDLLRGHLGYPAPASLHIGMVLDSTGQRLAKRTGGFSIEGYRQAGGTREDLLTWAASVAGMESAGSDPRDYLDHYLAPPKDDWWPSYGNPGPYPNPRAECPPDREEASR